jgi:hypothetical protein
MAAGGKIPSKKILLWGIFCVDAKSQRNGQRLRFLRGRSAGGPISTGHCCPAEYLKIYERKPGLEPEKKLMLAVLEDAIGCFQNFVYATDNRQKKSFLEAKEWFNEEESEWIFYFENICDVLRLDPQYLRQGLISWKANALRPV